MKLTASLGRQVPDDPSWIARRLRDTERAVQEGLAAAGELAGATIRNGLLRIIDYGGLYIVGPRIDPATGNPTGATFNQFRWGALPDDPRYNHPDGSRQMGWLAFRDDGTPAMAIAELRADDGQYSQALVLYDRSSNVIVAEDTNSGQGLARPHLGQLAGAGNTNISTWPSTTATTWTAIWNAYWEIQNPKLSWNAQVYAPAGVVAQWRVKYGSNVIGTSDPLDGGAAGTFGQFFGARVTVPGACGDERLLSVEAIILSGAGESRFNWLQVKGDQS